ncbi:ABC transporter permease subunit [bacterium]|nr:ABC transporter permease subunit [candidate division CSSED10-310 bacterium]
MTEYVIRRLMMIIPVMLGVSLIVFFMVHLIPGDPVVIMLGETAQPADIEAMRRELGLDQSLPHQLLSFLSGLATGDLGRSLHSREPVHAILAQRFPATLELTFVSMITAILIALPLGIIAAVNAHRPLDDGSMVIALIGVSIPNFWLGPMLILLFSVKLDWLPVSGRYGPASYVLPAITLGTALAAILTRMTRSSLLEVLKEQYIMTAYAKGASHRRAILKHALRNALIPVITIMGLQFGALLGGSVITETVFSWPGIGRELIQAIQSRDYPVVQGCVLLISFCYVFVNLITDLTYGILDPRIQYASGPAVWSDWLRTTKRWIRGFIRWFPGNLVTVSVIGAGIVWLGLDRPGMHGIGLGVERVSAWLGTLKWLLPAGPIVLFLLWRRRDPGSFKAFVRSGKSMTGLIITVLFIAVGVWGPVMSSQDPATQDLTLRLQPPDASHLFGMDHLGRDLFSRVVYGAQISMTVGLIVTSISLVIGVMIGMISGYAGGWVDDAIMRLVDIMLAFPGILLAIAMVAVLGPDLKNVMIALCIMGWVGYARLARGQVLALREAEYIQAVRALGAGPIRIMIRHLLPNILAPLTVQATLGIAGVIIAEAGLSFLGLGVQPPAPSWGGILNSGVEFFRTGAHITFFPGLAIMIVVMGLNFLGDGLRDALDPRI